MSDPSHPTAQDPSYALAAQQAEALAQAQAQQAQMQAAQIQPLLFSILKRGASTAAGPYSQEQILQLLQTEDLNSDDFIYYDGLPDWQRVDEVFDIDEQITHFVDDGQDPSMVAIAFREIGEILSGNEEIYYIAVQDRTRILTKARYCIGLSNKRLFVIQQRRNSHELEAHHWSSVSNTLMRDDGNGTGTFSILLRMQRRVDINHLPLGQVKRLFQIAQDLGQDGREGEESEESYAEA